MNSAGFITDERNQPTSHPVLIVDKQGSIGAAISEMVKDELLVLLVGGRSPGQAHNIIYLPYKKMIPEIPDGTYLLFLLIADSERDLLDIAIQIIKKANQNNAKFIFICHREDYDDSLVKTLLSMYEKAYVIVLGELVLEHHYKNDISSIGTMVYEAGTQDVIKLSNMGLRRVHPIMFEDAIYNILQIIFGIQEQPKIALLFPKDPMTELAIAHEVQKVNPLVRINFLKTDTDFQDKDMVIPGEFALPEGYSVKESIKEIYVKFAGERKIKNDNVPHSEFFENTGHGKHFQVFKFPDRRAIYYGIYTLVIFLLFPLIIAASSSCIGIVYLSEIKHSVQSGNILSARNQASMAHSGFAIASEAMNIVAFEAALVNQKNKMDTVMKKLLIAGELTQLLDDSFRAASTLKMIYAGKSNYPIQDFAETLDTVKNTLVSFEAVEKSGDLSETDTKQFHEFDNEAQMVSGIVSAAPFLMGIEGKKTFLILFQNNMELRPGGGFIGSYALATVDKGHIRDFTIHNTYDADGQLKNHIEPPFAIRRYLPQGNLYLRDSSFDVDFGNSAQSAAYMLEQETGIKSDVVIGVDLTLVKNLIQAIGPVYIPEYNETVTGNTFFAQTEKHAEQNFFPGSTQKQDFLRSLFSSLLQKIQNEKNISYVSFFKQLAEAIPQKHLMIASSDTLYQQELNLSNLSSSLIDSRQNGSGVINDFIGVNDANLGANKSNYFLTRSIAHLAALDKSGVVQETVAVSYRNQSQAGIWPGGDYRDYLRVILPGNTNLLDIAIDKDRQNMVPAITDSSRYEANGFTAPNGLEVEKTEEQGKTIYGFFITIPAGASRTVTITYSLDQKSNLAYPSVKYNLKVFKQPGTDKDSYSFTFNYPDQYKAFEATKGIRNDGNQSNFSGNLLTDQSIEVDLSKR